MKDGSGQPISAAVKWSQEWQRLSWNATTQAMGHYLHGCANVVMTPTPQRALAALHKTQTGLLRLSAHMCVEAASLWRKQSAELLALWALPTTLRRRG